MFVGIDVSVRIKQIGFYFNVQTSLSQISKFPTKQRAKEASVVPDTKASKDKPTIGRVIGYLISFTKPAL